MSTYGGRRGPNVSQYLRDLNSINPQEPGGDENFTNMGSDGLSMFLNTEFFDYDSGQNLDFQAQPSKGDADATPSATPSEDPSASNSAVADISNLDFSPDFNFAEFNTYHASPINSFPDNAQAFPALQPNHGSVFNDRTAQQQARFPDVAGGAQGVEKRKLEGVTPASQTVSFEDASRHAAEEDKRRRNTAASARFRVKKKQREQALERSAKDMTEKVAVLESKVSQLETENKWLKNLLVEKNEGNEDITALWKEFTKHAGRRGKPASKGEAVKPES